MKKSVAVLAHSVAASHSVKHILALASLAVITFLLAVWPHLPLFPSSSSSSAAAGAGGDILANADAFPRLLAIPLPSPSPPPDSPAPTLRPAVATRSAARAVSGDPNRRSFEAYGSAAALFVLYGAYRGGESTFAIVGLASKPAHVYGTPYFKCEWVPTVAASGAGDRQVRTIAYKILPDWGYGRVYTVVVVNCTFPENPNRSNLGGRLLVRAYYSAASRRSERFVALEESPGAYDEAGFRPPFRYDYLYCGSSLYGNLSAERVREWLAYHARFFGPRSHFVLHDAGGVTDEVRSVLRPWVRAGRVTLQDVTAQAAYDGYYYNQFLVVNDCLHRYRTAANWTFFFDVDEYLYLPGGSGATTLEEVMASLAGFTQFTIPQNLMSSKLCVRDPEEDYSRQWGFEKLVFRNSITGIRRDRKYAIQARNAYSAGVHMSQNLYGRTTHRTDGLISYYHYHNSINVLGEPCREFVDLPASDADIKNKTWKFEGVPYVYDDTMKRVADEIKQFERETIGEQSS